MFVVLKQISMDFTLLHPQYIGPFKILERIGPVTPKLELSKELSQTLNTFCVSKP